MFISILINYIFGLLVDKYREYINISRLIIMLMIFFNIYIFFNYKYYDFFVSNINLIFNKNYGLKNIELPIGISFFTFQAMSYVFDVYRRKGDVQKNPLNVALYIMLFPQLIAGPIVRYETISNQINNRKENFDSFNYGVKRFIFGLYKKMILSNSVAIIVDNIYSKNISEISILTLWIASFSYTFQIYFDFSGYSDMAIGLGKMFGFNFEENFNYPYRSISITEFWRRWHISLSSWFRDYVYISLGGSKVTLFRNVFNLLIVWLLTGIWHGANWTFIVWGMYYFIFICIEKILRIDKKEESNNFLYIFRWILVINIVNVGWIFFRSHNIEFAINYIKSMMFFNNNVLIDDMGLFLLDEYKVIFFLCIILSTNIFSKYYNKLSNKKVFFILDNLVYMFMFIISVSYILNVDYNPFIYFNF